MTRILVFWTACVAGATAAHADGPALLWSRQPAQEWLAAMPLGNGRLGAMVFGSVPGERIQLNEESLWAGEPFDVYPKDFAGNLKKVQTLVLAGRIAEARELGMQRLTAEPTSFRSYEPLADLWIELDHAADVADYRRELDLQAGIARVDYRAGGVLLRREMLISAVDDVVAIRLSADRPAALSGRIRLARPKDMKVSSADGWLSMDGQIVDVPAPAAYDDNAGGSGPGGDHMRFAGRLLARNTGGTLRTEADSLVVTSADEVTLLFTARTDFSLDRLDFDRSLDPGAAAEAILDKAAAKGWQQVVNDHVREHRSYFDRVSIDLGRSQQDALPTDERLAALEQGTADPGLAALFFQYGRYLLMSSSRPPGRLPANLQGIWSDQMWAAWEADYHLNINLQMNYWPADVCNLSETMGPLTDWFERVTRKGAASARKLYDADGWVAFTTVNLFGRTTPGGSTIASQYMNGTLDPLAGAWMAMSLWSHYAFTRDEAYLRERAYPILEGASEFLLDILVEDGRGNLTIVPSTSPENSYIDPATGRSLRITHGSTYHLTVAREVLASTIRASQILGEDAAFRERLAVVLRRLPASRIGPNGTIQEWCEPYREAEPGHRHMSHLLGLHPFEQITPATPALFDAARKSLERRLAHGSGQCGWSRAWMISMAARLRDGDQAGGHVGNLLRRGTHANFFEADPPFQIDAFLAGTAGIAEMLLQSHRDELDLLAALPKAWPNGHVHGLKARGGFVVDLDWRDGMLTGGRIHALVGGPCRLRCDAPLHVTLEGRADFAPRDGERVEFTAEPGLTYRIQGP